MAELQQIIKLTQAQYDTLAGGGTVGDYTGLSDNFIYLVPDEKSDNYLFTTNFASGSDTNWTELTTKDKGRLDSLKTAPDKIAFRISIDSQQFIVTSSILYYLTNYNNELVSMSFFLGNESQKVTIAYQDNTWKFILK